MLRHAATAILLSLAIPACAEEPPLGPEGPVLLVGNKGEDTVSFVELVSGKELGRTPTGKAPHEIAVSPDGKQAAVVAYGDKTIDIFRLEGRHWILIDTVAGDEKVRAEPFEAFELNLALVWAE